MRSRKPKRVIIGITFKEWRQGNTACWSAEFCHGTKSVSNDWHCDCIAVVEGCDVHTLAEMLRATADNMDDFNGSLPWFRRVARTLRRGHAK